MAHTLPMEPMIEMQNQSKSHPASRLAKVKLRLMAMLDGVFVSSPEQHIYSAQELSSHLQRDIGINR